MLQDLQSVLDAVMDGIIVCDSAGRIEQVNTEACRILETSGEATRGQPVEVLVSSQHPLAVLTRRVLKTARATVEDEVAVERRFGDDIEVDVAVSPLFDGRQPSGAVVVLRDRTVPDSLRKLVAEREQLATYGHIAAGIAHEVKNPLGGIRGAAELLEQWVPSDRARRTARMIVSEVDRISSLVDELMVFARGEDLALSRINIHRVLDGVIQLLSADPLATRVEIERIYDPSIPDFEGDSNRLTQVFLNLGRNALQALSSGEGKVSFSTRMPLEHRLSDRKGHHVPTIEVAVSDSGPGMAPDVLKRLATPFFTTKVEGTGLGLAVSRHWVTRHGGALRISSKTGEGTRVRVSLPLSPVADDDRAAAPQGVGEGELE